MSSLLIQPDIDIPRRRLIGQTGLTGLALLTSIAAPAVMRPARASAEERKSGGGDKDKDEQVTPPEDLMREHGVLDRVLLIYEAAMRKISAREDFDPRTLTQAAEVVRDFIENYHEKSEEEAVFPRFRQAGKMKDLVDTLLVQHLAGRRLTGDILRLAPNIRQEAEASNQIVKVMQSFIGMYRPHAAREDTDLFPKLHEVVSKNEYDAMAEDFEKKEHQLFGEDGFEKMVDRVAVLERAIGINDLNQFTPR